MSDNVELETFFDFRTVVQEMKNCQSVNSCFPNRQMRKMFHNFYKSFEHQFNLYDFNDSLDIYKEYMYIFI